MSIVAPTELQLDALREVANIGCGHAANALSQLVGGRVVELDVPRVMVATVADMPDLFGGGDARVMAASLEMTGDLQGRLLLLLPEVDAHRLAGLLLNTAEVGPMTEVKKSALAEAANIVASACVSAIADLIGLRLLPTPPVLTLDAAGAVMDEAAAQMDGAKGLVVALEARFFTRAAPPIAGQFLVLPDAPSLKALLGKLGV